MQGNNESSPSVARRRFLTSASAGAAAAAAMVAGVRPAAAEGGARAPLNTPITNFLAPEYSKMLTPGASKLTKQHLLDLRHFIKSKKGTPPAISVDDMNSIEAAFDSSEMAKAATLGYKAAGLSSMGIGAAAAQSVTACCCCCPCCSTAAAVTRPTTTV